MSFFIIHAWRRRYASALEARPGSWLSTRFGGFSPNFVRSDSGMNWSRFWGQSSRSVFKLVNSDANSDQSHWRLPLISRPLTFWRSKVKVMLWGGSFACVKGVLTQRGLYLPKHAFVLYISSNILLIGIYYRYNSIFFTPCPKTPNQTRRPPVPIEVSPGLNGLASIHAQTTATFSTVCIVYPQGVIFLVTFLNSLPQT